MTDELSLPELLERVLACCSLAMMQRVEWIETDFEPTNNESSRWHLTSARDLVTSYDRIAQLLTRPPMQEVGVEFRRILLEAVNQLKGVDKNDPTRINRLVMECLKQSSEKIDNLRDGIKDV